MSQKESIRLEILKYLKDQQGYVANQEEILAYLKSKGYAIPRDHLHIELNWLDSIAECIVDSSTGGVHIALLTGDGLDVVDGLKTLPGIRRPLPAEING